MVHYFAFITVLVSILGAVPCPNKSSTLTCQKTYSAMVKNDVDKNKELINACYNTQASVSLLSAGPQLPPINDAKQEVITMYNTDLSKNKKVTHMFIKLITLGTQKSHGDKKLKEVKLAENALYQQLYRFYKCLRARKLTGAAAGDDLKYIDSCATDAVSKDFKANHDYVADDLSSYGWVWWLVGCIVLAVAVAIGVAIVFVQKNKDSTAASV